MKMEKNLPLQVSSRTFVIPVHWSTNIGNAFFALGIEYLLKKVLANANIIMFGDQAAYFSLIPGFNYRKEPKYSLHYIDYLRIDYIVLTGSVLTCQFPRVWERTLRELHLKGVKILFIGVGQYDYSEKEVELCRNLLKKYPPYVFISRDHITFMNFHDICSYSYNGIDGAYFLPDLFQPVETDLPPYVVFNFDKMPEPRVEIVNNSPIKKNSNTFCFRRQTWKVDFPRFQMAASKTLKKGFSFVLGAFGLHGTKQNRIGDLMIVRTDHQVNPIMLKKLYRGPNSFAADIPYSYLNIYSQTELTLTDRIHAALVTMAYGRPAMLFSRSNRALIIDRVGGHEVLSKPTFLDLKRLKDEKKKMIEFLRSVPF